MLVLARKKGEKICIGTNGEIEITVVEIRGDKVRLGIEAEREIPVHRSEIHQAIQAERPNSIGTVPLNREQQLLVALKNLVSDVSRGYLDADSHRLAGDLVKECEAA